MVLNSRDLLIAQRVLAGEVCRIVAADYGLTTNRVQQIVHAVCRQTNPQYYATHWGPPITQLRADRQLLMLEGGAH